MQGILLVGTYDPWLVMLSVALAVMASYTALDLAGRIRASTGRARLAWLSTAAIAMGGGTWAMHFVAILGYRLGVPVSYDVNLTLLSLLLPILVTGLGFAIVSRRRIHLAHLVLSGTVMGFGIAAMHYMGMQALRIPAQISYNPYKVVLSVLIAVCASLLALYLTSRASTLRIRLLAAAVMGSAVVGMHYTALEAASFVSYQRVYGADAIDFDQVGLAFAIGFTAFLIFFLALMSSLFDRRFAGLAEREAEALRESERRFRDLYRSTPLPLHSLDSFGRLEQVSDAWVDLLGYQREEVIGRPLSDFMMDDPEEALPPFGVDLKDVECRFLSKSGDILYVLLSAHAPMDPDGSPPTTLGGIVDITARRKAEELLRQSQKMEALGQLTGGVAHDFNNLLTVVLSSLSLLEPFVGDAPRPKKLLDAARQAVRRGSRLSQSLLAFARRQPLKAETLDANALLKEFSTLIRRSLGETVKLDVQTHPNLPLCRADATQLQTAILNLAVNARDAMPEGGVLSIKTQMAVLSERDLADNKDAKPGAYIEIQVKDTGHGMTPDVLQRAFEPFFTTKQVGKGTGLGLSQVYGSVRQLGGHLRLQSIIGHGTTITLFLPQAVDQHLPTVSLLGKPTVEGLPASVKATVLVVEDEAEVRESTQEMLKDAGWTVLTAEDGVKALEILQSDQTIDVLFSDVVMPNGINGVDLAKQAKMLRPSLGILLASGYTGLALGEEATGFDLLPKPYDQADLMERLQKKLPGELLKVSLS